MAGGFQLEPEQMREYGQLQADVAEKLRYHAYIDDRNAWHVFQYLVLPSFTPPIAWDVFRRRRREHADEYVLLRSSWRSDIDQEKLRTPVERLRYSYPLVPSIEVHELPAPPNELERLATELAALELRIGASSAVTGVDGVTFEVAIEQPPHYITFSAKCRISWWCEPPSPWEKLRVWVAQAESVFESAWTSRGDAAPIPVQIREIDDAAARHEAQFLFHKGQYGRVAELLSDISSRERLTLAEAKMLELALKRFGIRDSGTI